MICLKLDVCQCQVYYMKIKMLVVNVKMLEFFVRTCDSRDTIPIFLVESECECFSKLELVRKFLNVNGRIIQMV